MASEKFYSRSSASEATIDLVANRRMEKRSAKQAGKDFFSFNASGSVGALVHKVARATTVVAVASGAVALAVGFGFNPVVPLIGLGAVGTVLCGMETGNWRKSLHVVGATALLGGVIGTGLAATGAGLPIAATVGTASLIATFATREHG